MANSLVTQYREHLSRKGQTTDLTDRELTVMLGNKLRERGDFETEQKYPDFRREYLELTQNSGRSLGEEFGAGMERGWEGLKSTAVGAAALGLDAVGADDTATKVAAKAKEIGERAGESPATVGRMEDVQDVSGAIKYLVGKAGEVTPSIGEAIVTSIVGGAIGGAASGGLAAPEGAAIGLVGKSAIKQLIKSGVAKQLLKREVGEAAVEQALKAGGNAALEGAFKNQVRNMVARTVGAGVAGANSFGLSAGEIYNDTGDVGTAAGFGAIAAIPDTVLPAMVLKRYFPNLTAEGEKAARGFIGRLLVEASKDVPIEAGTEAFQELVGIAAKKHQAGEPMSLTPTELAQIREAAVGGAVGGGLAAPVAAVPSNDPVTSGREATKVDPAIEARRRAAVMTAAQSGAGPRTIADVRRETLSMSEDAQLLRISALEKLTTRNQLEQWELDFLRALNAGKAAPAPAAPTAPATSPAPAPAVPAADTTPAAQPVAPVSVKPVAPTAPPPAPEPVKLTATVIRQKVQNLTNRLVAVAPHVSTTETLNKLDAITKAGVFSPDSLASLESDVAKLEANSIRVAAEQGKSKVEDAVSRAQTKKLVAKKRTEKQIATLNQQLTKLETVEQPAAPAPSPTGAPETPAPAGSTVPPVTKPFTFGRLAAPQFDYRGTLDKLTPEQLQKTDWDKLINDSEAIKDGWRTDQSNASQTRIGMAFLNPATGEVFLRGVYPATNMGGVLSTAGARRQGFAVQDAGKGVKRRTVNLVEGTQPALLDEVVKQGGLVPIARVQFVDAGRINENFPSADAFFASASATAIAAQQAEKRDTKTEARAAADVAKLNAAKTPEEQAALARAMIKSQESIDRSSPPSGEGLVTYGDDAVAAAEAGTPPAEAAAPVRKFGNGPWVIRQRPAVGKWSEVTTLAATATDAQVEAAYTKALAGVSSGYVQVIDTDGTAHATVKKQRAETRVATPVTLAEMKHAYALLSEGGWVKTLLKRGADKTPSIITDFFAGRGDYEKLKDGRRIYDLLSPRAFDIVKATLLNHERLSEGPGAGQKLATEAGAARRSGGNRHEVPANSGGTGVDQPTSPRGAKAGRTDNTRLHPSERSGSSDRPDSGPRGVDAGQEGTRGGVRAESTSAHNGRVASDQSGADRSNRKDARSGASADSAKATSAKGGVDSGRTKGRGVRGEVGQDGPDAGRRVAGDPSIADKLAQAYHTERAVQRLVQLHDFIASGGGQFGVDVIESMSPAMLDSVAGMIAAAGVDLDPFIAHIQAALDAARGEGDAFAAIVRGADPRIAGGVDAPGFFGFESNNDGVVEWVMETGPAEVAGLRVGDKILKANVGGAGQRFTLSVERDGRRHIIAGWAGNHFDVIVDKVFRKRSLNDALESMENGVKQTRAQFPGGQPIRMEIKMEHSAYTLMLIRALRSLGLETTIVYGYTSKNIFGSAGKYTPATDSIKLYGDQLIDDGDYVRTLLHEGLHAATFVGLITQTKFREEVESIRNAVLAHVADTDPKLAALTKRAGEETWNTTNSVANVTTKKALLAYLLGSPEEFVAGLAEPKFVDFLKGIQVKKKTAFRAVMDLIWKFFSGHGIAKQDFIDIFTKDAGLKPGSAHTALLASTLNYIASGDAQTSRRSVYEQRNAEAARHTRIGGSPLDGFFDPLDGKLTYREALPDTVEAALWNVELNAPPLAPDMGYTEAMARVQAGAWNELIPLLVELKKELMPAATDAEFWKVFGRGKLPTDIIDALEKRVPGSGTAKIGGEKMTDPMNQRARFHSFMLAQTGANLARRRHASSLETTARVSDELIELAKEVNKAERHFMDADAVNVSMVEKMREMIRELSRDMDRGIVASKDLGVLTGAIREVEGLLDDQAIPDEYQRVLKQVMDTDGIRVFDQLSAIANLNLPLGGMKVNDILATLKQHESDPRIAALLANRPLAVALSTLARNSVREMDLMQLRVMRDQVQALAIRKELDEIRTASDERLEQLAKTINASRDALSLRDRLRAEYIDVRRKLRSKQRVIERATDRQRVLARVEETLREKARALSRDVGAFSYWEPRDGATYWAMYRDDDGQWVRVSRKLTMVGPDITAQHAQVSADMAMNRLWLEAHKGDAGTRFYEEIKKQTQEISLIDVSRKYSAAHRFWMDKILSPIGQKFAQMGGAAGKRIQQMFHRFQFVSKTHADEVEASARSWTKSLEAASKAAGYAFHRQFFQEVYDPVIYAIESAPGLEEESALREAIRAAKRRIPEGQKVSEDFADKMKELLRRTKATSELMLRIAERNGVFVADRRMKDPLTGKDFLQRHAIKYGWLTVPRRMRPEVVETLVTDMRKAGWKRDAFKEITEVTPAAVAPFFTDSIVRTFVEPFVNKPGKEVFFGAANESGENEPVSQLEAQMAWQRAGGDVLAFIDELFAQTFNPRPNVDLATAREEYRKAMLNRFAELFGMEEAVAIKSKPASSLFERMAGAQPKPHRLMDGRHNDLIPPEHFQYETFDHTGARVALAEVAFHSAFGRDGRGLDEMLTALSADLEERARQYKMLPAGTRKAKKLAAEAQGMNFEELERAWKDHERVEALSREVGTFFDKGNSTGAIGDERAALELVQLNAALVLNQPKSGIWNLMSLADFPVVLGAGKMGVRGTALATANLMKGVFGSMLEAANINILRSSDYMKEVSELVEGSKTQELQFGEFMSDIGKAGQYQEGGGNRIVQASRVFQQAMRRGIKTSDKKEFAHFNGLWSPFQFLSHQAAMAIATANVQNFELMVKRAIKFFQNNPEAMNDPAFRFTAKDLGMEGAAYFNDERAFQFYRDRAIEYRVGNIEDVARDAMKREGRLLTRDQALGVAMMALNEISMESSINSRPIEWFNNPILRYGGMLLGWPLAKMHQVNQSFKTADGRKNLADAMSGLGIMAAWSLPLALAYSLLMDDYDEDIIGKKSNLRGIDPIAAVPVVGPALALVGAGKRSGWDNYMGMMERFARAGGYGLAGDFANSLTNVVDGTAGQRDFSLDTRILAFSQFANLRDAIRNWIHQDFATTYDSVGRPLMMMLGGNGVLQATQTVNNLLGLENSERWVTERINVGNWLRAAGREVGLELKAGAGRSSPTPVSVWERQMYLSALANDRLGFLDAYRQAVAAARGQGNEDPEGSVLAGWRSRNPLSSVFRQKPTEEETARLLAVMDDDGRQTVREALRLYDQFTDMIEPSTTLMKRLTTQANRGAKPPTIEQIRRRAATR